MDLPNWECMSAQEKRRWAYVTSGGDFKEAEKLLAWIEGPNKEPASETKIEVAFADSIPNSRYADDLRAQFKEKANDR